MANILDLIINNYPEEQFLKADGLDDAVIGVEDDTMRLIYSEKKVIEILVKSMSLEDAIEHFDFNIAGGYVGKQTPIWCKDYFH